jgi:hypothetical protein
MSYFFSRRNPLGYLIILTARLYNDKISGLDNFDIDEHYECKCI